MDWRFEEISGIAVFSRKVKGSLKFNRLSSLPIFSLGEESRFVQIDKKKKNFNNNDIIVLRNKNREITKKTFFPLSYSTLIVVK